MSVHFLVDKLHKRLEEVEAGSGLNCLDDAGDVAVVEDGDDIGSTVGQRVDSTQSIPTALAGPRLWWPHTPLV